MSDLISRKTAIDAIEDHMKAYTSKMDGYNMARRHMKELISALPSAQPEITLESAIDYLHAIGWMQEHDRIMAESAQPEIIRCKDCKHRPTPTRADEGIPFGFSVAFPDEICPCQCEDGWYNWCPKNDFYCGFAERREE